MKIIQKFARNLLEKTGYLFVGASKKIYLSEQEKTFIQWINNKGDTTLRLTYPLNENSIVFDIGGYEGSWTSDIYAKYNCYIHVFEPVKRFAQKIKTRFEQNKKIIVHDVGLGGTTQKTEITLNNDASSTYKKGIQSEPITIIDIYDFITKNKISFIDLMKINIEGGEYELLERLIETNLILKIKNIQVQFHDFIPDALKRMTLIQNKLQKTHTLTYHYPFMWENWAIGKK